MGTSKESGHISRRNFLARSAALTLVTVGAPLLAACSSAPAAPANPTQAGAPAGNAQPSSGKAVEVRAHMVKKQDVSDWIQMGLDQDIDGFKSKHSNITVKLETIPGWTAEYIPKILSMASGGQLGDLVWYPPRHRSHIAWGTQYNVVRDLTPLAQAAKYDPKQNFYAGAVEVNSNAGKMYWMSYISEPIVPVIAFNKTKIQKMGLPMPKDDWTFTELASWAQSATKEGTFGYYSNDSGNEPFGGAPYLRQWGVEPVSKDGKKTTFLDTKDAFINALKFRYDLTNTWKVSPSPAAGAINGTELFGGQKVLAVDIWPFRIQIYPSTFKDFEIDFVLTPVVNKGDKRRSMLNEHVFGITNASKDPAAAFEFLTWISGKEMNVQGLVQGQKGPIARADVWADDRIYANNPTYKKLKPIMDSIEPDYVVANYRGEEFDTAYGQTADAMILGKTQPAETATQIQQQCQAVLDKEPA